MDDFLPFVKRLIVGADDVFFRDVIKASTGQEILQIDNELHHNLAAMKKHFLSSAKSLSLHAKKTFKGRSNELSNYIEKVVLDEVNKIPNYHTTKPSTSTGKRQSSGYPDLFVHVGKQMFYLEVKTFQSKTKDSSLRTFYFKPSAASKITASCPHLLIAFEVESLGGENKSPFVINHIKILDLYNLKVSLKPEFNASNVGLYSCDEI